MEKQKDKKILFKDYVAVFVMFLATILVVLCIAKWYNNYKEYELTIPVISGKISEISVNDFENYLTEHENFYLYICTSSNLYCRNIEKDLPKMLDSRNIKEETIYINVSNISDEKIMSKLGLNKDEYPAFIIYKNGLIYGKTSKTSKNFDIGNIEKLLDEYEVGK
ncbi:MAG: hypothetical protein PUD59_00280 [bacterium]|nr:hypothetical protein [bacterium]